MKTKVIFIIIVLVLLIVITMVFATEQPSNEDLVTVVPTASINVPYVVPSELDEGIEPYAVIYDDNVSSSDGFHTVTLKNMPSGTKSFNYYYQNTGAFTTTMSVEYKDSNGNWTEISGSNVAVQPGDDGVGTVTTNGYTQFRIQIVNYNAGTYPISGHLKVASY